MAVPYVGFPTVTPQDSPLDTGEKVVPARRFSIIPDAQEQNVQRLDEASQSFEKAGQNIGQIVSAKLSLQNEATATDASTEYMKGATSLYSKFSQLEGRAANDALPEFQANLQALWKQSLSSMPNAEARQMLDRGTRWYVNRYYSMATDHADGQLRTWLDQTANNRASEFGNNAALAATNGQFGDVQTFLDSGEQEVRKRLEVHGVVGEDANAQVAQWRGKYVSDAVRILTDQGNVQSAQQMLDANKGTMDAGSVLTATAALKPKILQQQAISNADFFMGTNSSAETTSNADTTSLGNKIIQAESGGVPTARNPNNPDVAGAGQFSSVTWLETARKYLPEAKGMSDKDLLALRDNLQISKAMTAAYANEVRADLSKAGLPTDDGSVYMGYVAGPGAATAMLKGDANAPISNYLSPEAIKANLWQPDMTVSQLHSWAAGRVGDAGNSALPDKGQVIGRIRSALGNTDAANRTIVEVNRRYSKLHTETATDRNEMTAQVPNLLSAIEKGDADESTPFPSFGDMRAVDIPPARAQAWTQEYEIAKAIGPVFKAVKMDTPEEIDTVRLDLANGTGVFSALAAPEHAALRDRMSQHLAKVLSDRTAALDKDPVSWIVKNDEGTAQSLDILNSSSPDEHAATFSDYATRALSAQERVGLPPDKRHVLTLQGATNTANALQAPGVDVKAQLNDLENTSGTAWPHVFSDLVTLGKLPTAYQAVGWLPDKDSAELSRWLRERPLTKAGDADVSAVLGQTAGGKGTAKVIQTQVEQDQSLQQTLSSFKMEGASGDQVRDYIDSVKQLAYAKAYYSGDPLAAQNAVAAFTSGTAYLPNGGARVPSEMLGPVSRNMAAMLQSLTADKLAVPPPFGQQGFAKPDEYADMVKSAPTWIRHGQEYWLMDQHGGFVRTRDGKNVSVPLSADPLPGMATVAPAAPSIGTDIAP